MKTGTLKEKTDAGCIITPDDGSALVYVLYFQHTGYDSAWAVGDQLAYELGAPHHGMLLAITVKRTQPARTSQGLAAT